MEDVVQLLKGRHRGTVDVVCAGVTCAGCQTLSWGTDRGGRGSLGQRGA